MNIFREVRAARRRSSSTGGDGETESPNNDRDRPRRFNLPTSASFNSQTPQAAGGSNPWASLGATATLRRVFLPRQQQQQAPSVSKKPTYATNGMSASVTSGALCESAPPATATVTGKHRSSSLGRSSNRNKNRQRLAAQPVFGRTQLGQESSSAPWQQDRQSGGVSTFLGGSGTLAEGPVQRRQQQQQPRLGKPRPVSADVSKFQLFDARRQHFQQEGGAMMSTSNSEFFRVRRRGGVGRGEEDSCDTSTMVSKDHQSLESLLDTADEASSKCAMTTSNTENSISTLNSVDCLAEDDDGGLGAGATPTTPTAVPGVPHFQAGGGGGGMLGSLQVKVQEIRAQLDVLKTGEVGTRPTSLPPPPPQPPLNRTQHPNTPAQGFEHTLPPNLVSNDNDSNREGGGGEVFFPLFPTNNLSDIFAAAPSKRPDNREQLLRLQQSLLLQSNPILPVNEAESPMSPSFVAVPFRLPLSVAAHMGGGSSGHGNGGSLSTSPSTLSPCSSSNTTSSSNAFPHSASSQQLYHLRNDNTTRQQHKMASSKSAHAFPPNAKTNKTSDKLFFFFDVIMTQEKIAKVVVSQTSQLPPFPLYELASASFYGQYPLMILNTQRFYLKAIKQPAGLFDVSLLAFSK